MKSHDESPFASLEMELRSLQALPPDPEFLCRLERKMNAAGPAAKSPANVIAMPAEARGNYKPWLAVAACAVVATGAVTWKHQQITLRNNSVVDLTPPPSRFVPQAVNSQFQRVHAGDLIMDPQRGPMRKVHFEFNNSQQFIDPQNGSKMEFKFPSHQEILISEPMQ